MYITVNKNTFTTSNLKYKVTARTDGGTKGGTVRSLKGDYTSITTSDTTGTKIKVGEGTLGKEGTTDTWTIELKLEETGQNQNADQNKEFEATITVESE